MTFFESTKVLMLSQGEAEAWELLDKSRFIMNQYPNWLNVSRTRDQRSELRVTATGSSIVALPSTENAGRSTDATLVIADEWEMHPFAESNFAALKPTIDAGIAKFVGLSTVKKQDQTTFPKKIWRQAVAGENNFIARFYGWRVVPTRTQEWYDYVTRDYDDLQREQEYPETIEEALSPSKTTCRFDVDALKAMKLECVKPIREEFNGSVLIYKEPVAGRKYCFPIDPSEGSYDPSLGWVIDAQTDEGVARYHGKIPIDEQARIIEVLYNRYNKAFLAPERNASGLSLIDKLSDMGITNFYLTTKDKKGWWTSSANRGKMLQDCAEEIRLRQYRIPCEADINEFLSFIRTEKHPDGVATGGCHDEAPIVWGIYGQMRKTMPMTTGIVKSSKMKERW